MGQECAVTPPEQMRCHETFLGLQGEWASAFFCMESLRMYILLLLKLLLSGEQPVCIGGQCRAGAERWREKQQVLAKHLNPCIKLYLKPDLALDFSVT